MNYVYQDNAALTTIAPELIQQTALNDPIFKHFPIREHDNAKIRWRVLDNLRGLMSLRGIDGAPTKVVRPGESLFEELPGYYGEYGQLDESELTERGMGFPASMTVPMDVSGMVREWQDILTVRQVQRMRMSAWTLTLTGQFVLALPQGGVGHSAAFAPQYPVQMVTVPTLWSSLTTATPLHDLRQLQLNFGRGTSNDFMSRALAYMTLRTAQYIMDNRNPNDLGGIRAQYGATAFNSIEDINKILLQQGAPQIVIFDDSYQIDNTAGPGGTVLNNDYQLYIPDGVVWVVAARPGNETPGEFMWTRHMINGGGTRPYAFVRDFTKGDQGRPEVPPRIEVHQGFVGGPCQMRPTQTATMHVA